MFLINYQYVRSYATSFVKTLVYYKKDLKYAVTVPLDQDIGWHVSTAA